MPKKKQVNIQNSIPGKYIPRDDPPPGSVFRSGANDNRFNAKMAEFLASSAAMTSENPNVPSKSTQDTPAILISEPTSIDSPRTGSSLLHRRIVTMLDTLKSSSEDSSALSSTFSQTEHPSQPITFGQLRQATIGSSSSSSSPALNQGRKLETDEKHLTTLSPYPRENSSDVPSASMAKFQTSKGRFYYSPSLEQLFEEQNLLSQTKKIDEQSQKSSLTVDDILAKHYPKLHLSTNSESHLPSSSHSNTSAGFYIQSSGPRWDTLQSNQHLTSPSSVLNEQSRNRLPPPPYPSGANSNHRTSSTVSNSNDHLVHSSISSSHLEQLYPGSSTIQHLLTDNPSTATLPVTGNTITNSSARPPPPRYQSSSSKTEQSPSTSSQQSKPIISNSNLSPSGGFDREFSRILYGKEPPRARKQKSKRKAFSDPDKKSVEEAKRTFEKVRRRLTTYINRTSKVQEKDDDETETETENENVKTPKQELTPLPPRRRSYRQSELLEKTRESAKKAIVPANPLLKRRIPSFLRVYSQASSSNDTLLQWHLFNQSELESFNSMMSRLYKNENLARVQLYELYRSALHSILASKTLPTTDDELDSIITPL